MQIKKFTPEDHKIKALIYGPSGSGKTVFSGTAQRAIYASAEGGLLSIANKSPDFVEIKSLKDLMDLYIYLEKESHEYDTVVIDSITEINEIIKIEIEKRTGRQMQIQDWGELSKKIRDIFRKFRDLPMNVLLIAQEHYITDEDKINKIVPSMNGKAATDIAYFMDIVGYIHIEANGTRWIETSTNKKLLTKDRSNTIPNNTPLDFSEWQKRIKLINVKKQEVIADFKENSEIDISPPKLGLTKMEMLFKSAFAELAKKRQWDDKTSQANYDALLAGRKVEQIPEDELLRYIQQLKTKSENI
jgi:hypothetical protein